jgi:hypothetical protein
VSQKVIGNLRDASPGPLIGLELFKRRIISFAHVHTTM